MFARFSVKKPYTVIVGVILVIVLGVVSFMNMQTDLLPSIDLPYVVVYTTYVGASPEQVETTVTKPLEEALASTTDLSSVQSVSSENVSMVILEYTDSANMDTALIEISSAISQIEGEWGDSVGSPVIMKINPDMMPVMVASVDYEGKDIYALSDYVSNTLMTELEGINGVASVDASGVIEEEISVTIRQSRIDAINNLILRDVDAELADVELELDEAQDQLKSGKRELSKAKKDAMAEIDSMIEQLESGNAQLPATIAQLETQRAQLASQREQLVSAIEQLESAANQQVSAEQLAAMQQLTDGLAALEAQKAALQAQLDAAGTQDVPTAEEVAAQEKLVNQLQGAVSGNEKTIREQQAYIDELSALGLTAEEQARVATLQNEVAQLNSDVATTESTIAANASEIETLQKQLEAQQSAVVTAESDLAKAQEKAQQVTDAQSELTAAQTALTDAEGVQSAAQTTLDTARSAQTATEAALKEAENADPADEAKIAELQEQLNADKAAVTAAETALTEAQTAVSNAQATVTTANAALESVQKDWDASAVSNAQTALNAAKSAAETTQASINTKTQENVTLRTQVTNNQTAAAEKQAELDALNAKAVTEEDKAKLASAQQLLSEAQGKLSENQTALAAAQQTLAQMQAAQQNDPAVIQQQITAIDSQITAIKESEEYQAYLAYQQLQSDPAAAQAQLTELKNQLAQMDAGIAQMDSMIAKLNSGILPGGLVEGIDEDTNLDDALTQLYAAREQAETQFDSAEDQIADGEQELAEAREEFETARDEALESANIDGIITLETVATILGAQNISMPAGYVYEDSNEYLVRVGDKFGSIDELKNLVLFSMGLDSVDEIRLMDIATVEITDNSDEVYAVVNGNAAVTLSFSKQSTASTAEVSDEILATFEKLEAEDSALRFTTLMDQGIYIDMIVSSVLDNLVVGGILAVIILAIFLVNVRPTIIVACAIPLSVVAAIMCMYFSGITLNIISLSGLSLAIGMLVDNAIVVIENIYRLRNEENMPIMKACVVGTNQVAGALVASTLTTICVFAPVVFIDGMTRDLFMDIALTIAYALLASLLIALTLVPMMSSVLLKKRKKQEGGLFRAIQKGYAGILRACLKFKLPVLALVLGLLVFAVMQAGNMGMVFLESMSSNQLTVNLTLPEETEFEDANAICSDLVDRYLTIEGVDSVGVSSSGTTAASLMGGGSGNTRSFYVVLDADSGLTSTDLSDDLLAVSEEAGYEVIIGESMMDLSALTGSGMEVVISGADTEVLRQIGADVAQMMAEIEGTTEIDDGSEEAVPQLSIVVDREKAAEYNLTVGQVMQTVATAINTGTTVTQMTVDGRELDVVVIMGENLERTPETVGDIEIEVTTEDGEEIITVADICDIEYTTSMDSINRVDQRRTLSVTCGIGDEYNVSLLGRELTEKLDAYEIPEGYKVTLAGENEYISDMLEDMILMITLSLVLIFLIMVAQFQSFFSPFIVLFTVPLAFTGGLLALYLLDMQISLVSLIGFLVLFGVVVNNGIVFVDSVNQMREAGMEKRAALVETGRIRLRPILMTALTTILGMWPMAMANGMGAEMMQTMAVVTIGGLSYATLMTLFVVPCLYDMFTRKKYKVRNIEE